MSSIDIFRFRLEHGQGRTKDFVFLCYEEMITQLIVNHEMKIAKVLINSSTVTHFCSNASLSNTNLSDEVM